MNLKDRIIVSTLTIGAIFTIFFAILIAGSMSSCTRVADENRVSTNMWRGTVLKKNKLIFVENSDSLPVMVGDTVTVFYSQECNNYYISNNTTEAADTATVEMYVDGVDTTWFNFQAWNVRLDKRVIK